MGSEKKLLVVDDEEEIVSILSKRLTEEGYSVAVAMTGKDALSFLRSSIPDLILMDIVLPDLDGAEVVKKLQKDPATKHVPVIFLSGIISKEGNENPEIHIGTNEYDAIGKPFMFNELLSRIQRELAHA